MNSLKMTQLLYPLDQVPGYGEAIEVAPGVHWARLPLPFQLDHINVWLLQGDDGLSLVDTGIKGDEAERMLAALIDGLSGGRGLARVYVTHLHPDHVGMAGWLVERYKAQFWMTRQEYLTARLLSSQVHDEQVPDAVAGFFRRAGWSAVAVDGYAQLYRSYGRRVARLPAAYRRLEEGQVHRMGGYDWRVIVGSGHSPEHACFYCDEAKLLISGDQVLPRISSNVSVSPLEPQANPMADWLASLHKLKNEVPDDVLVLPAHQECFRGLHARLEQLIDEQEVSFEKLRNALQFPHRAVDVFPVLFHRPVVEKDISVYSFATGESVACLNYLLGRGEITCGLDDRGGVWYGVGGAVTDPTQSL